MDSHLNQSENPSQPARSLREQPMVVICLVCCLGIIVDRIAGWCLSIGPLSGMLPLSISMLIAWVFAFRHRWPGSAWLLLLAIGFGAGAGHHSQWRIFPADHIALQVLGDIDSKLVAVRCRLTSITESTPLPDLSSDEMSLSTIPRGVQSKFLAVATQIRDDQNWVAASGKLDVQVEGHLLGVRVGDEVEVFGTLAPVPRPMNPGQQDLRLSQRAERILCRLQVPYPDCVVRVPPGPSSWRTRFQRAIGEVRASGLELLDEFVGSPRGILAGALLLGARDRLEPSRTEYFFHTGTVHLLAISGLHLGILTWLFLYLPSEVRFAAGYSLS